MSFSTQSEYLPSFARGIDRLPMLFARLADAQTAHRGPPLVNY
jgi:hypothetical protein